MPYTDLSKGRVSVPAQIYFITTVTAGRTPFFANFPVARLVVGEMRTLDEEKMIHSQAWVLMPDHLHWLFQLGKEKELSHILKLFKGRTARLVNEALHRKGPVWQTAFYDHALRKEEDLEGIANYIIANPLRKGLVPKIEQYSLWDCIWLPEELSE